LSSENTNNRVLTLLTEGEGNIFHSVIASYGKTRRSLRTPHSACVEASYARIGRAPVATEPSIQKLEQGNPAYKNPPVSQEALIPGASLEHENRAQVEVMAWVEEVVMPSVQLIMPPAVGHNIVPGKQANKGNTVAPAEPVEFVAKDVTKRNTLENAAGATQDTAPGYCADLPAVYMECAASYDSALDSR